MTYIKLIPAIIISLVILITGVPIIILAKLLEVVVECLIVVVDALKRTGEITGGPILYEFQNRHHIKALKKELRTTKRELELLKQAKGEVINNEQAVSIN